MNKYIPGTGNPKAKLLIVTDYPNEQESDFGRYFSGPDGQTLWSILEELGFPPENVWSTAVYKYHVPYGFRNLPSVCDKEKEEENFWLEVRDIDPNCILALGEEAFKVIRGHGGVNKWRGSILMTKFGDYKVVGTLHPGSVTRFKDSNFRKQYDYIWKSIIKVDIQRAIEESREKENNLEEPFIQVCRDSTQLMRYLERNESNEKIALDIESFNCIPIMIGMACSNNEALVVPLFNTLGALNIGGIPPSDQAYIWLLINKMLKEKKIIGQNFKYDQEKLEMLGFSFNPDRPIYSDTMIKAHTLNPELPAKNMQTLQSIWTRLPYHKDEGKEFIKGKMKIEKLFHYCGLDVISTFQTDAAMEDDLHELSAFYGTDLVSYFYDYKMLLHQVYLDLERVGFKYDFDAQKALKIKYQTQHDLVQARLSIAAPDFVMKGKKCHEGHLINVMSPPQMKKFIYEYLKSPKRLLRGKLKADEDTVISLLNNVIKDARRTDILLDILEDRKVRKTLGTYVNAPPDVDDRIRCSYKITGTETGRTSNSILKPPLRPTKSGHAFQTLTKHGEIGKDIRTLYLVDEDWAMVNIDLSQAEPRIVAHLCNDEELSKAFRSGKVDIHRRTAALVLNLMNELNLSEEYLEIADSIPKDSPQRFLGKVCRNGGNYDMGKKELAITISTQAKKEKMDVSVSEWRANKMLESFHAQSPKIRGVFHAEVREALDNYRRLINPYGKLRVFYGRLNEKSTYGEGYAEIPQSTVADHVKVALLKVRKEMPDFKKMLLGESHDAITVRFPLGEYIDRAKVIKKYFETPIDFSNCTLKRGLLSIPSDLEVSFTHYGALEKMKI